MNGEGGFRVAVAADGPTATELRVREGLQPWRPDFTPRSLVSTEGVGDPLRLEVFDAGGRSKKTVEVFEQPVTFRGVVFDDGPLVAVASGLGLRRQSPELRRHVQLAQTLVEAADPVIYARHLLREPLEAPTNTLVVLTAGDTAMPVSTGLALARAAGLLTEEEDARLVAGGVTTGLARLAPLVDPDDLSGGADGFEADRFDPPLRIEREVGAGQGALRIALVEPGGAHGVHGPRADVPWDVGRYVANLVGQFFANGSARHRDCLAASCP